MNIPATAIESKPRLLPSEDYYFLRRKGIEFIEAMGSRWWTDYNTHDPGITILEALCYAITDLGYRTSWDIKDILAEPHGISPDPRRQAFFTAREILTINPLTVNDFRKVLIDQQGVRNAWLVCKDCACEVHLYGDCRESRLVYAPPAEQKEVVKVTPLGTYDVLLELERHAELGDLNDRKVLHTFSIRLSDGALEKVTMELRFPGWNEALAGPFYHRDAAGHIVFNFPPAQVNSAAMVRFSRNKDADTYILTQDELRQGWSGVFYTTLQVGFPTTPPGPVQLENISLRLFAPDNVRRELLPVRLQQELEALTGDGAIVRRYFRKMEAVARTVDTAKQELHKVRNLCEDFCCTSQVCVEDVAVCADIEVKPDADIERVLAQVLFAIEQYFNPPIRFFSLQELLDEGEPVDRIFEGPQLNHGFIKTDDLEASQLKTQLRTSDIINLLMDIEGVVAVKSLLLTKYDQEGLPVLGVSDHGNLKQMSARWTLAVSNRCQPRLYLENSKFLFFKNDLPFKPRMEEMVDTLQQLRGEAERLKIRNAEQDLAVPQGEYRSPEDYYPVQYSFPLTYGIGYDGLPEHASPQRRGQARQLKAYLLFFEQLLANSLAQLAHSGDLFALDPAIDKTYYVRDLRQEALIRGVTDIVDVRLTPTEQQRLAESEPEYLDRRNRFLDHLLGRFSESFADYALALYSYVDQKPLAQTQLIQNKINFLLDYPVISHDRARAINYLEPSSLVNHSGLRKRIARLLGFDTSFEEKIIVVEHILLRPKFPGDALMQVCLDKDCTTCGEEDPYSFQMTIVMPGWAAPFDTNLDLRRFADRTIRLETPAHILVKICWVGNRGDRIEACEPVVGSLAELLMEKGITGSGLPPDCADAGSCADWIYQSYHKSFNQWVSRNPGMVQKKKPAATVEAALRLEFAKIDLSQQAPASCNTDLAVLRPDLENLMAVHFTDLVVTGFQYDKFRYAWEKWLDENQKFDWCERHIRAQVEAVVAKAGRQAGPDISLRISPSDCACQLLETFGTAFYAHIRTRVENPILSWSPAREIGVIFRSTFPNQRIQCGGTVITGALYAEMRILFVRLFRNFFPVTTRLLDLLHLLSQLNSIYPKATLHDCDDGSDLNPVRLGSTALGGT